MQADDFGAADAHLQTGDYIYVFLTLYIVYVILLYVLPYTVHSASYI